MPGRVACPCHFHHQNTLLFAESEGLKHLFVGNRQPLVVNEKEVHHREEAIGHMQPKHKTERQKWGYS